jgi:hypothetical protein
MIPRERLCTHCPTPHVTGDFYVIDERGHPCHGDVECREAHEIRVPRETRGGVTGKRELVNSCSSLPGRGRRPGGRGNLKRRLDRVFGR